MKKHKIFTAFFGLAFLTFLWDLIVLRSGFLSGDYSVQFYPWSVIYARSVKGLQLPFWIRYVQSGFPLMAEGQVGGFYPPHIFFYYFLPFRVAYNYLTIFHFAAAGIFTYLYAGKLGACRWGGTIAALIFCFGSAYAGCMINTATLKTLAWFPLVLLLIELYFDRKDGRLLLGAGSVLGIQLLAGATQVGFYAVLLSMVYFATGLILRKRFFSREILYGSLLPVIALGIFLPQLLLTRTMSALSWRSGASLDFALTLSMSPLNFMSAFFPRAVFHGPGVYIGVLSLLFFFAAINNIRKTPSVYPLLAVLITGVFIALGRYNPFFVMIIRALEFYDFRGPSKVILFSVFSASILSGVGFTHYFSNEKLRKKALQVFAISLTAALTLLAAARIILLLFRDRIISFGEYMVMRMVYGKPFHRHDLNMYMDKVRGFYDGIVRNSSLTEPFMLFSVVICVLLLFLAAYLYRHKSGIPVLKLVFFTILFADLLVFSGFGTGFRGNIQNFDYFRVETPEILSHIQRDRDLFRILPYDLASGKLPAWADPSLNAIYDIDSVALYTPLANEYYRRELEGLEVVDNALGYRTPAEDAIEKHLGLLRALNVKYVVSPREIEKPFLRSVMSENGVFLYEIKGYLPRAFVLRSLDLEAGIDPEARVEVISYSSGKAFFSVEMPYDGFLAFSENRYPGWTVRVNGEFSDIETVSVLQAVRLSKGKNNVEFVYSPLESIKYQQID